MNIVVAGDFCDSNRVSSIIKEGNFSFLFDEIKPIVEKSDLSIVNFEFPVAFDNLTPILKQGPTLKGQVQSVDAIRWAGFKMCTLANNHILDLGYDCCIKTKELIESKGLITIGVGENLRDASSYIIFEKENQKIGIINCCEKEFSIATASTPGANALNPINLFYQIQELKKKVSYILVIVHGGIEHYQLPSPRMQELYRFLIDCGADVVINHHQHCFTGYEIYNSKPIFYGIGNFLFDKKNRIEGIWTEGFMVDLHLSEEKISFDLIPYFQSKAIPKVELMKNDDLKKFNIDIENFNAIISNEVLLKENYEKLLKKNERKYLGAFEPYNNRILRALYHRNLIPSLLSRKHLIYILGYINCESHFDQLLYSLKSRIYK